MFENVPLFRELYKVMSWQGGPVNWNLAGQTAVALASPTNEQPVSDRDQDEFARAVEAAELWLDEATDLAAVSGSVRALSRREWVELACTPEGLGAYAEPIAAGMSKALRRQLPEDLQGGAGAQLARGFEALSSVLRKPLQRVVKLGQHSAEGARSLVLAIRPDSIDKQVPLAVGPTRGDFHSRHICTPRSSPRRIASSTDRCVS
jgi:uncharacterized protein (DUF2342 family)